MNTMLFSGMPAQQPAFSGKGATLFKVGLASMAILGLGACGQAEPPLVRTAEDIAIEREDLPVLEKFTRQLDGLTAANVTINSRNEDGASFTTPTGQQYSYDESVSKDSNGGDVFLQSLRTQDGTGKNVNLTCKDWDGSDSVTFSNWPSSRYWYENLAKGEKGKLPVVNEACGTLDEVAEVLDAAP